MTEEDSSMPRAAVKAASDRNPKGEPPPDNVSSPTSRVPREDGEASASSAPQLKVRPKVVVFDFDGTLANSLWIGMEVMNQLSTEFGHRSVTPDDVPALRDMGARRIMKTLGIKKLTLPKLLKRARKEVGRRINEIEPFDGVLEVLEDLKTHGYELGVLTSNHEKNVHTFCRNHGYTHLFEFVTGKSSVWGKKKDIARLLTERGLQPTDCVYVGDERRDIEACRANDVPMIAVGWGFNSERALLDLEPTHYVRDPQELRELLLD